MREIQTNIESPDPEDVSLLFGKFFPGLLPVLWSVIFLDPEDVSLLFGKFFLVCLLYYDRFFSSFTWRIHVNTVHTNEFLG
jgi:hypothetical protein